jgi:hypothetical protein
MGLTVHSGVHRRVCDMQYAAEVKRTTVMLPDELDARLRREAVRRGVSIADVVREALEASLPEPTGRGPLSFFGIGQGWPDDASERVDEIVGEAIARSYEADVASYEAHLASLEAARDDQC